MTIMFLWYIRTTQQKTSVCRYISVILQHVLFFCSRYKYMTCSWWCKRSKCTVGLVLFKYWQSTLSSKNNL